MPSTDMTYCTGLIFCISHHEPCECPMIGKCDRYVGNHDLKGDVWQMYGEYHNGNCPNFIEKKER